MIHKHSQRTPMDGFAAYISDGRPHFEGCYQNAGEVVLTLSTNLLAYFEENWINEE